MGIDASKYDRRLVNKGKHFYADEICLNEVIAGKSEELLTDDYIPRNELADELTFNLKKLEFKDEKNFSSDGNVSRTNLVEAKAELDVNSGIGLSYFGAGRLIKDINVIFYENSKKENIISFRPGLYYERDPDFPGFEPSEDLQILVGLAENNFKEFFEEAKIKSLSLVLTLEMDLEGSEGIFEPWDPVGGYESLGIVKILTDYILEVSHQKDSGLQSISKWACKEFSYNWEKLENIEKRDESDLDENFIEWDQSKGSKEQLKVLEKRLPKPSWIKKNWFWLVAPLVLLFSIINDN